MAPFAGLRLSAVEGNRNFAEKSVATQRKRKHVGWIILVEKLPIEPLQLGVVGDQTGKGASIGNFMLQAPQEGAEFFAGSPAGRNLK